MKTRHGYVSNSSSSSFVLLFKENAGLDMCGGASEPGKEKAAFGRITADDLIDMFDSCQNYCTDSSTVICASFDSLVSYVNEKDEYGGHFYDEERDDLNKKINELKDNYPCGCILRLSYHDKFLEKLLKAFISSGEMINLSEWES